MRKTLRSYFIVSLSMNNNNQDEFLSVGNNTTFGNSFIYQVQESRAKRCRTRQWTQPKPLIIRVIYLLS